MKDGRLVSRRCYQGLRRGWLAQSLPDHLDRLKPRSPVRKSRAVGRGDGRPQRWTARGVPLWHVVESQRLLVKGGRHSVSVGPLLEVNRDRPNFDDRLLWPSPERRKSGLSRARWLKSLSCRSGPSLRSETRHIEDALLRTAQLSPRADDRHVQILEPLNGLRPA